MHMDVLIVGAGLSGIDAAYRLQTLCRGKRYAILEAREAIGGTWDLFRYPGIRSDSDMATLGFPFRPWRDPKSIAGGEDIRAYVVETAHEFGIDRHIRFGHRVDRAEWSGRDARWTVDVTAAGQQQRFTCNFLYMCAGYYDFAQGFSPEIADREAYQGLVVHPQHWPQDLDISGKRIVVIGSGATAVTLAPSLLPAAAHVTMLQRSPTYIVSRPAEDRLAIDIRRWLPAPLADWLVRWKNVGLAMFFYRLSKSRPERVKALILEGVRRALGEGHDIARDYTPRYNPWDQRVCLIPDGDLFRAIRKGSVSVVTDTIQSFTPTGLALTSGRTLDADIVVMATGLQVRMLGGAQLVVDGEPVSAAGRLVYRGVMLAGIPNLAFAIGYTNASWTLKCDLSARYVCRLLNHMDSIGARMVTAEAGAQAASASMLDLQSGYLQRAAAVMPRQGAAPPWKVRQNYLLDMMDLRFANLNDGVLTYETASIERLAA